MAVQHIKIATNTRLGGQLKSNLDQFFTSLDSIVRLLGAMPYMIDSTDPENLDYNRLEQEFGIEGGKGSTAKAELDSFFGKLTTDDQVQSVKSAGVQVRNFFA